MTNAGVNGVKKIRLSRPATEIKAEGGFKWGMLPPAWKTPPNILGLMRFEMSTLHLHIVGEKKIERLPFLFWSRGPKLIQVEERRITN